MPGLSLRQAAVEVGASKSTILRAIQSGRLSATRTDDGGYDIAPSELFRVYPPKPQRTEEPSVDQDTPLNLHVKCAELEANLNALKEILAAERERRISVEQDRDRWADQAQRLALPAPAPAQAPVRDVPPRRFAWFRRSVG